MTTQTSLTSELIDTAHSLAQHGLNPATSGCYSARVDDKTILITAFNTDKSQLTAGDLLRVDLAGKALESAADAKSSAESLLHTQLYSLDSSIGAVLHTQSVAASVLSRLTEGERWTVRGYGMQEMLADNHSFDEDTTLWLTDNNQDPSALADTVAKRWQCSPLQWGFIVRGHGLYTWGKSLSEARRHTEAIEFLLNCSLEMRRLGL